MACRDSQCDRHHRRLEGKVCIVTGGASGIGEATVKLFAEEGAKVIIADLQDEPGRQLVATIGENVSYTHCDVTQEEEVSRLINLAVTKYGRLDVMFNNAGIAGADLNSLVELDMKDYEKVMAINVRGMLLGTKHAARVMIPSKKGSIICTASVASLVGGLPGHAYTISKHAVVGVVRSAASELSQHGISVNAISPAGIATPLSISLLQHFIPNSTVQSLTELIDASPGFRGAKFRPAEVAKVALFLASEDGRYISGQNLVLDGADTLTKRIPNPH